VCVCVCAFLLHRESPDMILGDKPLISEVVLSHRTTTSLEVNVVIPLNNLGDKREHSCLPRSHVYGPWPGQVRGQRGDTPQSDGAVDSNRHQG
jgi:hypothetical protein